MLHAHLIWRCKTSKIGSQVAGWNIHRDQSRKEMLIMTPSGSVQNEERAETSREGMFEFLTTFVEGYAVDTEPSSGRDGSRCTPADMTDRTSPSGRGGGSARGQQQSGCT